MSLWENLWDVFWLFFWILASVAYVITLFSVVVDLFRDRELSGPVKALWAILFFFIPFLTVLVYLIFRGQGMQARRELEMAKSQQELHQYLVRMSASGPVADLARAKEMHAAGELDDAEFAALKAKIIGI